MSSNVETIFPLAPSQLGIFLECLAGTERGLHVEQAVATARGPLDVEAFADAWRELIAARPVLRTGYVGRSLDRAVQVVFRVVAGSAAILDWRGRPRDELEAAIGAYAERERLEGFDLGKPPLMRMTVIRTATDRATLLWTHHHILMDGWCISLLIGDLLRLYEARVSGARASLPSRRPFQDYVAWVRGRDRERSEVYFRERLRGVTEPTPLGRDAEHTSYGAGHGEHVSWLPDACLTALRDAARRHRLTVSALLSAAWAGVLARYAGRDDVTFGVTVSGRPSALVGVEGMIGLFAATLPLRARVLGGGSLSAWLATIADDLQGVQEHAHVAAGVVHECSAVPRHAPLYESLLVIENYPIDASALAVAGLEFDVRASPTTGARTRAGLAILLSPLVGRGIETQVVFDRGRLFGDDVARIPDHLERVVVALCEQLERGASLEKFVAAVALAIPTDERPRARRPAQRRRPPDGGGDPVGPTEALVVEVWARVLELDRVDPRDNFFELGGHSLLAAMIVARVGEALGRDVPLRWLFEHPTARALARRVSAALREGDEEPLPPVAPVPRDGPLPVSFDQERIWFIEQMRSEARSAYVERAALELTGALDGALLRRSLFALIDRHEALRTRFVARDGSPAQLVMAPGAAAHAGIFRARDLSQIGEPERVAAIKRALVELDAAPFELDRGPLIRVELLRLSAESHVLALAIHHIITDGWSNALLFAELGRLYRALAADEALPACETPAVQYADYAAWQRRLLGGARLASRIEQWRARLRGAPERSTFPADFPRSMIQSGRGATASRALDPALARRVLEFGRRRGATVFMTVLAAFAMVLARHSGQADLVLGTPVAGRDRPELERVFGLFVRTLAVRVDLSGDPSFDELVARAREATLWAQAHDDVPFERLVEALCPARTRRHNPIFQVFINMLSHPPVALELGELRVSELEIERGSTESMFDMTLYIRERGGQLRFELIYDRDLFHAERARCVLEQLAEVLQQVTARPERSIDSITLGLHAPGLPDPKRRLTTHDEVSIPEILSPASERVALIDRAGSYSYERVHAYAATVAAWLRARGVQPGGVVAVYARRCAALVPTLLGVLDAGATICVLDAAYPAAYLVRCLASVDAVAWITLEEAGEPPAELARVTAMTLPSPRQRTLPAMASSSGFTVESPTDEGRPWPSPDAPAYILFTSGSTGEAKAVVGSHRPVVHFLAWARRALEIDDDDRFCLLAGLAHDPMLRDILLPLSTGATLCVPRVDDLGSGAALVTFLAAHAVTVLHLTPSLARLLEEAPSGLLPRVRLVCFGGETLTESVVRSVCRVAPRATCINFYGATETPQAMTWAVVARPGQAPAPHEGGRLPIGHAIDDVQVLVRDRSGRRAGPFEIGELAIRTPYLARYLGGRVGGYEPDPEPASTDRSRVYATGDLGYYRPDGVVMCVGRRDRQVKIRGNRVEPGELERVLVEHPGVRAALVVVDTGPTRTGGAALIAYWVAAPEVELEEEALREHIFNNVPRYMFPQRLFKLDAIPLTPNGKPDLAALPEPGARAVAGREGARRPSAALCDAITRALIEIYAEVLGADELDTDADFFAIGGHSLMAAKVVSRARQRLGVALTISDVFDRRTIRRLAALIREREPRSSAPIERRAWEDEDAPLSDAQRRLWVLDQTTPGLFAYNMSDALLVRGPLDRAPLEASLRALVTRHEALRTVFPAVRGVPRQRVLGPETFSLHHVALDAMQPEGARAAARTLAREHARTRFDLRREPPFRVTLARLGAQEHALLICMHHIIADRWSLGVLRRDMLAAYRSACAGQPVSLPPLAIQYRDYTVWQQARLEGDGLTAQREYWRHKLADAGSVRLDLPLDAPRPPIKTYEGASVTITLGPLAAAIDALARRLGTSAFVVLVALVKVLLHRYSGQDDILVGAPVAGRGRLELEDQVGCYVNMVVLRDRVRPEMRFDELVRAVHSTATEAYRHQDYPFDRVVDDLHSARDPSRAPLVDVVVVLQESDGGGLTLPGLKLEPLGSSGSSELGASKFELTFAFEPVSGDMRLHVEYATALFERERIERMSAHLRELLAAAAREPTVAVGALTLMPAAERRLVVERWNQTDVSYPRGSTIVDLFREQVEARPDDVALVVGETALQYSALARAVETLARRLRARYQLGAGCLVPVIMTRSERAVIAILAILATGAAYVPVDPALPAVRCRSILADTAARVVVSESACSELLSACLNGQDVAVALVEDEEDEEDEVVDATARTHDTRAATPEDPAYVIFTSGSTGRPKGCVVHHRNVVRLLRNDRFPLEVGPGDVWLAAHSLGFDFSVWELLGALTTGGRVVLATRDEVRDVPALHRLVRRHRVSVLSQTPAAFYGLIEVERREREHTLDEHLRYVVFGGDRLEPARLAPWARVYALDRVRLINMYGITETTVHVTHCALTDADVFGRAGRCPIGVPLPDTRVYVCDERGRPQPIGIPGEILVGGGGVCGGYLKRPELTARRFIADPFREGGRLYRSGDIGVWRADGALEYIGRDDGQVQLRGFRIELEEVSAALLEHPGIRAAAALVREAQGDGRLVVYLVPDPERPAAATELRDRRALRDFVAARLPSYMIPAEFDVLDALPLTANGKIDRHALASRPLPRAQRDADAGALKPTERTIHALWRRLLGVDDIGLDDNFFDLGGHSLLLVQVRAELEVALDRELEVVDLFRFPTIRALARRLSGAGPNDEASATGDVTAARSGGPIAIIGMAGRFPGAASVPQLWANLCEGVESVRFFTDAELEAAGVPREVSSQPGYVKAKAVLDDVAAFDAEFFAMSPREAAITDPQHRVFLECAWHAFEDAGYGGAARRPEGAPVAVFAGSGVNGYLLQNLYPNRARLRTMGDYPLLIANDKDYLAARVSYKLNLRGPSVSLGTACSTSLVAVEQACEALRAGKAALALAGGVSIKVPTVEGYLYQRGGILSPDGRCRAFDADASGTIGGSGAAAVVLKPLDSALADGDHVYAVIRGVAVNNDGADKVGFTAPGVHGQAEVIRAALRDADVEAESISYVEAHGTGTRLGDPIELEALNLAHAGAQTPCALGSVKTNLGHLDAAAGVTGLIKAALAVEQGVIPPSLHFTRPNPAIHFGRFEVCDRLRPFPGEGPRRAGVSSFGLGGTNVHVILEQAPARPERERERDPAILVASGRTPAAADALLTSVCARLDSDPPLDLHDVAHTLQLGRAHFEHRRALVCGDGADARLHARALVVGDPVEMVSETAPSALPGVTFLCPGMGNQRPGMARALYEREPVFRAAIERGCEAARALIGLDPRVALLAGDVDQGDQTALGQSAVFVLEHALIQQWMHWGVKPRALVGHSLGELVAACVAGVFELEGALAIVAARARLVATLPPGRMMVVGLPEDELRLLLASSPVLAQLDVAVVNGPQQCVVAGPVEAVGAIEREILARELPRHRLRASRAFHSRMTEPVLEQLAATVASLPSRAPQLPYTSSVTGTWITEEQARDPWYYARHLRETVRFDTGLRCAVERANTAFIEVGPGAELVSLARRAGGRVVVPSFVKGVDDRVAIRTSLARVWAAGVEVDWSALSGGARPRRVPLPGYPFARERHWIEPPERGAAGDEVDAIAPDGRYDDVERWFYEDTLERDGHASSSPPAASTRATAVVLLDGSRLAAQLAELLRPRFATVLAVPRGEALDPLLAGLAKEPVHIIHTAASSAADARALDDGYDSLLELVQAIERWLSTWSIEQLEKARATRPVHLSVIASGLLDVAGESRIVPDKAALLGVARVAPQELAELSCRVIDILAPAAPGDFGRGDGRGRRSTARLVAELLDTAGPRLVALRRRDRWVHRLRPRSLSPRPRGEPRTRSGPIVITGGTGGIGMLLAEHLACERGEAVALLGRSVERARARVHALARRGATVLLAACDIADRAAVADALGRVRERLGVPRGVIHAAGETSDGSLSRPLRAVDREGTTLQFRARVEGLRVLDELLAEDELDFAIAISSNAAVLGGLGLTAYAAVCNVMDAHARSPAARLPWVSAGWDRWPTARARATYNRTRSSIDRFAMGEREAIDAFARVLDSGVTGHIVVSAGPLGPRLRRWIELAARPAAAEEPEVEPAAGEKVAPRDEVEQRLAAIWRDLLGVLSIGVHDNFFELGGDSLLGTQVINRAGRLFEVELPMSLLFERPTVAGVAARIVELRDLQRTLRRAPGDALAADEEEGEI